MQCCFYKLAFENGLYTQKFTSDLTENTFPSLQDQSVNSVQEKNNYLFAVMWGNINAVCGKIRFLSCSTIGYS